MKKLVVFCLAALTMMQIAFAQDRQNDRQDLNAEIKAQRDAILKERQNSPQPNPRAAVAAAVTAADVGEPDSFGKTAQFLGIAQSGAVLIDPTCDPVDVGTLGPDDHCITVPDPSIPVPATTFNDIARITIPGKSVSNIIYAIANHTISFDLFNPNATPAQGRISYVPTVTIESVALNDPSLINPITGLPFNGSFTTGGVGAFFTNKTLQSGDSEFMTHFYSRANTSGFSRTFFSGLGLPANVIKQLYNKPVTIRLNVTVSSRFVDSATLIFTARFLGN
jgi:hypothetical protein